MLDQSKVSFMNVLVSEKEIIQQPQNISACYIFFFINSHSMHKMQTIINVGVGIQDQHAICFT